MQKTALPETDVWETTENLVYDLLSREPYIRYVCGDIRRLEGGRECIVVTYEGWREGESVLW